MKGKQSTGSHGAKGLTAKEQRAANKASWVGAKAAPAGPGNATLAESMPLRTVPAMGAASQQVRYCMLVIAQETSNVWET